MSGQDGHFVTSELKPGEYRVHVERRGYLDCDCLAGVKIATDQKITGVQIKLTQYGSIAGRVMDADGDAWPQGNAILFRLTWRHGRRKLSESEQADVDDRGMFRVGKLAPGRYYVAVQPGSHRNGMGEAYQTSFYPGAIDPASALAITLQPGQDVTGIEIKLHSVAAYRVRGRITGLDRIDLSGSSMYLDIVRASDLLEDVLDAPVDRQPDGTFEFRRVPTGSYIVRVGALRRANTGVAITSLGEAAVQVNGHDVNDVTVELIPATDLKVNVEVEGATHPDLSSLIIAMSSDQGSFQTANAETGFTIPNVARDTYFISLAGGAASRYFVKAIRAGSALFPGPMLDLRRTGDAQVTIVLSEKGATLTVSLKAEPPDPTHTTVLLIPDTGDAELREQLTIEPTADNNDVYSISNIPPGDYRLFAWHDLEENTWNDPDFWTAVREKGIGLKLKDSDRQSVQVPLIPAADMAAIMARLGLQ